MPRREDFQMKEQLKIEEGVFENRTMMRLRSFFTHGIISSLEFIIAKGKEADIYLADGGASVSDAFVAVKIFRLETSSFAKRADYINGDPRFGRMRPGISELVNVWCRKEYGNLKIAGAAGIHAPRPYLFNGNVIAMELIGDDEGRPAPTLKDSVLEDPEPIMDSILLQIGRLYVKGLVHSDVSEYNILIKEKIPYFIDFGQAVVLEHPMSKKFLERDIANMLSYFRKQYGIERDLGKALMQVTQGGATGVVDGGNTN